jgi:uncharacterized protein (DUF1800 family)
LAVAITIGGAAIAGCGGGGGGGGGTSPIASDSPTQPAAATISSQAQASRFLAMATMGASLDDIQRLSAIGYDAWLNEQFNTPTTSQQYVLSILDPGPTPSQSARIRAWWNGAILGDDQLRQRVAWALSQIFVVSENDLSGTTWTIPLASYYDMLADNAFGTYRELLEQVTLHPAMGVYLSMVRNEKADPARNIRPDENYAREVMQLFSVGLTKLNLDGTAQVTSMGAPAPTYDQSTIEQMAKVFTGWTYAGSSSFTNSGSPRDLVNPMIPFDSYHDMTGKAIIDSATIPAGQTARQDLEDALDILADHPNVGPFICKQLIQRLTTSNPSTIYVRRVATVFNRDEFGIRGNLKSVIRAILLDPEAINGTRVNANFGKLKEPILRHAQFWRAFKANSVATEFFYNNPERDLGQAPLRAPTVFNFYRPDYQQPGAIAAANLDSPEFQILTESFITNITNRLYNDTFVNYSGNLSRGPNDVLIHIGHERNLASNATALVDHLDLLLLGGAMSQGMRGEVTRLVQDTAFGTDGTDRVLEAIFLIVSSPEYAVQE